MYNYLWRPPWSNHPKHLVCISNFSQGPLPTIKFFVDGNTSRKPHPQMDLPFYCEGPVTKIVWAGRKSVTEMKGRVPAAVDHLMFCTDGVCGVKEGKSFEKKHAGDCTTAELFRLIEEHLGRAYTLEQAYASLFPQRKGLLDKMVTEKVRYTVTVEKKASDQGMAGDCHDAIDGEMEETDDETESGSDDQTEAETVSDANQTDAGVNENVATSRDGEESDAQMADTETSENMTSPMSENGALPAPVASMEVAADEPESSRPTSPYDGSHLLKQGSAEEQRNADEVAAQSCSSASAARAPLIPPLDVTVLQPHGSCGVVEADKGSSNLAPSRGSPPHQLSGQPIGDDEQCLKRGLEGGVAGRDTEYGSKRCKREDPASFSSGTI